MAADTPSAKPASHRPRTTTVFVAAFVAGAAAAVGVNRALDVHLAQAKPQVECEPIFVALRALPSGAPITVWDVALRDLPKAMVPATALRVTDSFEGRILKFPLREGQPLISGQLVQPEPVPPAAAEVPGGEPPAREELVEEAFVAPVPAVTPIASRSAEPAAEVATQQPAEPRPTTDAPAPEVSDATDTEVAANGALTQAVQPAAEPAAETPAEVAAAQPMPAAEPTPAAPAPEPVAIETDRESVAAAPAVAPIQTADQSPTGANSELDMPSPPPVDVSKLPSVMASDGPTAAPEGTSGRPGVRYLVVPERIARQADTSFTTPAAPSAAVDEPVDQAAAPPPQATVSGTEPAPATRQPQAQTAPPRRPQQAAPAQRKPATRQPDQRQTQPRQMAPRSPAQPKPSEQSAAQARPAAGPRAWGGMFPNVSAGLEAFGGWRSGRTAPDQSAPGSTTR